MSIRLALIYGGRNGEHDVSRRSAASILDHLDREAYRVTEFLIGLDGRWQIDVTCIVSRDGGGATPQVLERLGFEEGVYV